MAVTEGRKGKVTVVMNTTDGAVSVAEMGEWSITGMSLPMIEYSAFEDTITRFKPGQMDPGNFTFSGYFDGSTWDSVTAQGNLITCLNNGYTVNNSSAATAGPIWKMRLWANGDSDLESYGFWSCTGSSGSIKITGLEVGTAKDGVGTVSFVGKVATGRLEWSTSTSMVLPAVSLNTLLSERPTLGSSAA